MINNLINATQRGNILAMKLLLSNNTHIDLSNYTASDYFDAYIEESDIQLIEYNFNENILGHTCKDDFGTSIAINSNLKRNRRNFTLAHEIGHLELHVNDNDPAFFAADLREHAGELSLIEREANAFAAGFLMPKSTLIAHLNAGRTACSMAETYRVSRESLFYRMISYLRHDFDATYHYAETVTQEYFNCLTRSECLESEYLSILNATSFDLANGFI